MGFTVQGGVIWDKEFQARWQQAKSKRLRVETTMRRGLCRDINDIKGYSANNGESNRKEHGNQMETANGFGDGVEVDRIFWI